MPSRINSAQRARQASLSSIAERGNVLPVLSSISKNRKRRHRASIESQGRVFTGLFECMETISGEGTIAYPSGDRYDQIKTTVIILLPLRRSVPCRRFNGRFENGLPEGKGVMTWVSGNVWEGKFKDGLIHGQGIFRSSSTSLPFEYRGGFINGKFEGQGLCRCRIALKPSPLTAQRNHFIQTQE